MQHIVKVVSSLLIAAAIAGVGGTAIYLFKPLYEQKIENQARFECAQSSRYTTQPAENVEVWYPVAELYEKCLAEKNIQ